MLKTHVEAGCYATYATYLERRLTITKYVFGQENYIWRNFEFVTIIEFKNNGQKYFLRRRPALSKTLNFGV